MNESANPDQTTESHEAFAEQDNDPAVGNDKDVLQPFELRALANSLWLDPPRPGWIWRGITSNAAAHAHAKTNGGRVGLLWRFFAFFQRFSEEFATGQKVAQPELVDPEVKNRARPPDKSLEALGRFVAFVCVAPLIPFWLPYVYLRLTYDGTRLARHLLHARRIKSDEEAEAIAVTLGSAAFAAVVLITGLLVLQLTALLILAYPVFLYYFIEISARRHADFISVRARSDGAVGDERISAAYSENNEWVDQEVEIVKRETFDGKVQQDSDIPALLIAEHAQTPLEQWADSPNVDATIVAQPHHRYLPRRGELQAITAGAARQHVIARGPTRSGKTTKLMLKSKRWLCGPLKEHGVGGIITEVKGKPNPHTGRSGSMNIEDGCDLVWSPHIGNRSAVLNLLRAGGKPFMECSSGRIDARKSDSFYKSFQSTHGASLIDALIAAEKFISEYEVFTIARGDQQGKPALRMPEGGIIRIHPALQHLSFDVLAHLINGTKLGEDIAKGLNRLLEAKRPGASNAGSGAALNSYSVLRGDEYWVPLDDSDYTNWQKYYREVVGQYVRQETKKGKWEWVFKSPPPQLRQGYLDRMLGFADTIAQMRKGCGRLIDDSDPNATVMDLLDTIEGNAVYGFCVTGMGGEVQRIILKLILRMWTDLIVDKGFERDRLESMFIMDEMATALGDDEDFAENGLAKLGELGGGFFGAYQNVEQWAGNEKTLGSFEHNCGTRIYLTRMSPDEAAELIRTQLPKDYIESSELSPSYGLLDVDEQTFGMTGYGRTRHEHERCHYSIQDLSQVPHYGLITGENYNGRHYANRFALFEKNKVQASGERAIQRGENFYLATPGPEHPLWGLENADADLEEMGVADPEDTAWADVIDEAPISEDELSDAAAAYYHDADEVERTRGVRV